MTTQPLLSDETLPSEEVFVNMNGWERECWRKEARSEPLCSMTSKHQHPLLAAQRFVLERMAFLEAQGTFIVDVGGCPKRTFQYAGKNAQYLCPLLQPGDSRRVKECPPAALPHMCHCTLEKCPHVFDSKMKIGQPSTLIFVHSAYYIDPMFLWKALSENQDLRCLVVGHDFPDPFGGYHAECEWVTAGEWITMTVRGQRHQPYCHKALPWTTGWRGPNGECFEVDTLRTIGATSLWSVEAVIKEVRGPVAFDSLTVEDAFIGPVQFTQEQKGRIMSNGRLQDVVFDLDHVYRCGSVLYTTSFVRGVEHLVTVPLSMISLASTLCVGRIRDPQLLADVLTRLRRQMEQARVPHQFKAEALLFASALGMCKHVNQEIDVLYTVQNRFGRWFTVANQLLQFQLPPVYSCLRLFLYASILLVPTLILSGWIIERHDEMEVMEIVAVWMGAIGLFLTWGCCLYCSHAGLTRFYDHQLQHWRSNYRDARASSVMPGIRIPTGYAALPAVNNVAPPPIRPDDPPDPVMAVNVVAHPPPDRAFKERELLNVAGLVPQQASVNVLSSNQEVEASFLGNRLFSKDIRLSDDAYSAIKGWFDSLYEVAGHVPIDFSRGGFLSWLSAQRKKFPSTVIKKWEEVEASIGQEYWAPLRKARTFTKIEKSAKYVTVDGQKPIKPRGISPPSDEHKVVCGPIISQLYRAMCKFFSFHPGNTSNTIYCSGVSTDEIGSCVDEFLDRHPDAIGVALDCSNYDASLELPLQLSYLNYLEKLGFSPGHIRLLMETPVEGFTASGLEFKAVSFLGRDKRYYEDVKAFFDKIEWPYKEFEEHMEYKTIKMWSGRMDTNLCDSLILTGINETFLDQHHISEYLLLICGDDMFLLVPPRSWSDVIFDKLQDWYKEFGMFPEGTATADRSQWEFCSKLFWWGINPETRREQTVLGPKVGRTLARFGYTVAIPNETNIAGAALSLRIDAGHVPFVRCLAQRTYEICRDMKMKVKMGRREWEPMHASRTFELSKRNYEICEKRYNLSSDMETHFDNQLQTISVIPAFFSFPNIGEICEVDQ